MKKCYTHCLDFLLRNGVLLMNEDLKLLKRLDDMREKHRELDEKITQLGNSPLNQLRAARLKKEKLTLRDGILELERQLYPDIIA